MRRSINWVIVGALGLVAHYNGVDWHVYSELNNAGYTSVALKGNLAVAVGETNGRGFVAVGRRN